MDNKFDTGITTIHFNYYTDVIIINHIIHVYEGIIVILRPMSLVMPELARALRWRGLNISIMPDTKHVL